MSEQFARSSRRGAVAVVVAALLAICLLPIAAHAIGAPTVTGVFQASGPSSGYTTISVVGTGFTGVTGVSIGGVAAASVTFQNDSHLSVLTPPHAPGSYRVIVSNASGSSLASGTDFFTFTGSPAVAGVFPPGGPIFGGTFVTITGSGFSGASVVTFGGVSGYGLSVPDDNHITVFSPSHVNGSVFVVVWVGGVPSPVTFGSSFVYGSGLAVTGISPASGPSSGGTIVTISGVGFSGATAVSFGGVFASLVSLHTDGTIVVAAPPHFAGAVHVNVWVGTTPSTSNFADTFVYTGGPVVTAVAPASGPASGGTAVTVSGAGFLGAVAVTFGSASSTSFFVQSDNQLLAIAPPHTPGTVDVVVWTGSSSSMATAADLFTYVSRLSVSGISPSAGTASGGTVVTLNGAGFLGATSVLFGGISGSNMTILSDSQLRVTAPAHSAGAVQVVVVAGDFVTTATAAASFTFIAAPVSDPPSRFAGRVLINGQPAPAGTTIQARIGSTVCGSTTTFASGGEMRYVMDVAVVADASPGCGVEGAPVTFSIGAAVANQGGTWHNYQLNLLDLSVGAAPTVPPVPPQAPLPPNTGSFGADPANAGSPSWVLLVLLGAAAMATGAGTLAGMSRRPVAVAALAPVSAQVVLAAPDDRQRGRVNPREGGSASAWVAVGVVGAAAVLAGTLLARKRR